MRHIARDLRTSINLYLDEVPGVVLLGPRQVGKTTLARAIQQERGGVFVDLQTLQSPEFVADPTPFLREHREQLVVIDEVQRRPEVFSLLRPLIDEHRYPGRIMLLGSASPTLMREVSESLAGRVLHVELTPFSLSELSDAEITWESHLTFGGYPEPLLRLGPRTRKAWAENYLQTFVTRDLAELGVVVDRRALDNLLRMIAHVHGGLFNASALAKGLPVAGKTVQRYVSILEQAFLVRVLRPWFRNYGKRLVRSPRLYWRDSGLRHALLDIGSYRDLLVHPALGASWEGYAIEEVCRAAPSIPSYFYRTQDGSEFDLLLEFSYTRQWAFEMKFSTGPAITKGTYNAIATVRPEHTYIVTPESREIPLRENLTIVSLSRALELVRAQVAT